MSWCQVYPRHIAAIFSCFLVLICTQLPLYLLHDYAFSVQIIRPLPKSAWEWPCKHSEELECVWFSLVCLLSIICLHGDKNCCCQPRECSGFAVWKMEDTKEGMMCRLCSQKLLRGASPQRSQEEGNVDHINSRDSPRTCAEIKAAKNSL